VGFSTLPGRLSAVYAQPSGFERVGEEFPRSFTDSAAAGWLGWMTLIGMAIHSPKISYEKVLWVRINTTSSLAIHYDGSFPSGGQGYQVHVGPMYSNFRGRLKIKSADLTSGSNPPSSIQHFFLQTPNSTSFRGIIIANNEPSLSNCYP
jgi:hypothetical protein